MSFIEKLDDDALAYFNEVGSKPFNQQAVAFLNAYWAEVADQAEFIFSVGYAMMRKADMHAKGIQLLYQYDEGVDLDFDIALFFYEQLCKFLEDDANKEWVAEPYAISQPEMMTALKRKTELREKVDVNFDGRVSLLEYLLYQYQSVANPADFCKRSMAAPQGEHPEIKKAREALEEVNKRIREYEAEKARLEEGAKLPGVKGLRHKNELAQLDSSPLAEQLNKALITAEAAVRIATRKFGGGKVAAPVASQSNEERQASSDGAIWWMNRDLAEKKKFYGGGKKE